MKLKRDRFNGLRVKRCAYPIEISQMGPLASIDTVFVHDTTKKHQTLESLRELHQIKRKWAAIGYHFVIDKKGTIYQTRPTEFIGAHVYGKNRTSIGVAFLDIEECMGGKTSGRPGASFSKLVAAINKDSRTVQPLHIKSHTFGQFEYINELIEEYNTRCKPRNHLKRIIFGRDECIPDRFEEYREFAEKEVFFQVESQVNSPLVEKISHAIAIIKNCPGPRVYELFEVMNHEGR